MLYYTDQFDKHKLRYMLLIVFNNNANHTYHLNKTNNHKCIQYFRNVLIW